MSPASTKEESSTISTARGYDFGERGTQNIAKGMDHAYQNLHSLINIKNVNGLWNTWQEHSECLQEKDIPKELQVIFLYVIQWTQILLDKSIR